MAWRDTLRSLRGVIGETFTLTHVLQGTAAVIGMNVGIMGGMFGAYRWWYADYLESMEKFKAQHGRLPPEQHRLEAFAFAAEKYDASMGNEFGADYYRGQLLIKARGDVLEVAVGTGRCFGTLTKSGLIKSYVGVDKLQEMIDVAATKLRSLPFEARLLRADSASLPFPDKSFDTVIGSLCLCSVEQPEATLDEMARVCRDDGRILLVEPGLSCRMLIRKAQEWFGLIPDPRHAWTCGWFDDLEPRKVLQGAQRAKLLRLEPSWLGNWYMITAAPRVPSDAVTTGGCD
mmetsp:Transcript_6897/g.12200  ORF Transcript_6897/g.12200 Transcript_6897/m.12200 type:complete len:288 (+) Transcript_6897:57-920(+)